MRKPFIAGNWKMNTDCDSAVALAKGIAVESADALSDGKITVAICPPSVYLSSVAGALSSSSVGLGAQNVYSEEKGAFTGEVSVSMLKDVGCTYTLIGHSERRHVFGETNDMVNKKVHAAISGGLLPILCVGELLEEREAGKTEDVVKTQIVKGLEGVSAAKMQAVTLAYEPVWAIGTGLTASPQQAQEVHAFIRSILTDLYDASLAEEIRIQYGGSAKASNAAELLSEKDVDGLLVGGASLKTADFMGIIEAAL
ncbi:MAG: triose-phosphate isomerase [Planctomycetes bacterium]|nr:triose-phosphate isomerase [Planctomycetota bacterium]